MSDSKTLSVARAYHQAWSTRDLANVGRYLAEDLRVEVPINSYSGRDDFLEALKRTAQHTSSVTMLAEFADGEEAMLLYDMTLPIGELRVAEHFTISGGKIHKVRQIHDTHALRAAGMSQ
jgi:hypothetical protein